MNKAKDDNQNFAKAILNIRRDYKLTQEQFAEEIGVTRQAVSRWEMGISAPNMNTITLISEKFGVSIDAMLKATETMESGIEKSETSNKKTGSYGFLLLFAGIVGLIILPFLAEWKQVMSMQVFKTAYTHSYDYIFEYPLSILLMLSLLFIGLGIYIMIKKRRRFNEQKNG